MTLEYVDLEAAKAARGTRLVVNALVPSPWSEAVKACLVLTRLPAIAVRRQLDTAAIDAWTGIDNVPAVLHDREPVRSNWAAIVALLDRLARASGAPRLLPDDLAARAATIGTLEVIAGEEGVGWNARLAMIHAGLSSEGTQGFPPPVAKFLARRYGYTPESVAGARDRIAAQLAFLAEALRTAGGTYFGGAAPNAVDAYSATFLTPVAAPITDAECPDMQPMLRAAFASAHTAFGPLVPAALLAHREHMFTAHLPRPIRL